jgi:peptide/nickel transport system permease protein
VTRFVAGRLLQALLVLLVVATLTFVLLHLVPGDPVTGGESSRFYSQEFIEQLRRNQGLDRPIHEQYLRYFGNLLRGDLGYSLSLNQPVWHAIRDALPNTVLLALAALIIDFSLGISLGVVQGTKAGTALDRVLSVGTLALFSVPTFWFGIILLLVFGQQLGWFPISGVHSPLAGAYGSAWRALDLLRHLVLPALTLGLIGAAGTARYQRAGILEVLRQDFVRTARAKGLTERLVLVRHALRNALLPTITLLGLTLPALLSGAVLVETVFAWPGMGTLSLQAYFRRDYPVVTGAAMLASVLVVLGSLAADLLYRIVDPRTRADA